MMPETSDFHVSVVGVLVRSKIEVWEMFFQEFLLAIRNISVLLCDAIPEYSKLCSSYFLVESIVWGIEIRDILVAQPAMTSFT